MTMPNEMFQPIRNARHFMLALMDPKQTPKVPKDIRKRARDRLKHFPSEYEINELEKLHSAQDADPNVLLELCMKGLDSLRGEAIILERKINLVGSKIVEAMNKSGRS